MAHETLYLCYLNVISIWNIALTGVYFQSCRERWYSFSAADVESCLKIQKLEKRRPERQVSRNFESIYLTKFDATTRKLNHQYDIQFFAWYVSTKCVTARRKLNFWRWFHFVPYPSHVTWLYHVLYDTFTCRFCGGWVLQKVDINLLVFLENFWVLIPLGLFQILTILVLEYRCP